MRVLYLIFSIAGWIWFAALFGYLLSRGRGKASFPAGQESEGVLPSRNDNGLEQKI